MKPRAFITADDEARINEAIAAAEKRTAGEIVPVIAGQSSDYREATYLGGIIGALLVYLVAIYTTNVDKPSRVLLTLAIGYLLGSLLTRLPTIKRHLIGPRFSEEEVWKRAALEFQLNQVYRTSGRTGIVILVSLLERMVVVYGDQAIAAKLPQAVWDDVRDRILAGIKSGRPAEGLIAGILRCGEIMAEHFPIMPDDKDELPDRLVLRD